MRQTRVIPADLRRGWPLALRILNPRDFIAGALFILFGLAGGYMAANYPFGTAMRMGAGYFPALISVILVLLGSAVLVRSLAFELDEKVALNELFFLRPVLFVSAGVVAFALLVPHFGLLLSTLAMTLVSGFARRAANLPELACIGALLAGFAVLVFAFGLGLHLPILPVRS